MACMDAPLYLYNPLHQGICVEIAGGHRRTAGRGLRVPFFYGFQGPALGPAVDAALALV